VCTKCGGNLTGLVCSYYERVTCASRGGVRSGFDRRRGEDRERGEQEDGEEDGDLGGEPREGGFGAEHRAHKGGEGDGGALEGLDSHIAGEARDEHGEADDDGDERCEHDRDAPEADAFEVGGAFGESLCGAGVADGGALGCLVAVAPDDVADL